MVKLTLCGAPVQSTHEKFPVESRCHAIKVRHCVNHTLHYKRRDHNNMTLGGVKKKWYSARDNAVNPPSEKKAFKDERHSRVGAEEWAQCWSQRRSSWLNSQVHRHYTTWGNAATKAVAAWVWYACTPCLNTPSYLWPAFRSESQSCLSLWFPSFWMLRLLQ